MGAFVKPSGRGVVIDSRQQKGKHEHKHDFFKIQGVNSVVCALPFGDYALAPRVAVDTKKDIYELAMDIDRDHERFRNELVKARDMGCQLVILVENECGVTDLETLASWREDRRHFKMRRSRSGNMYARQIEGLRLAKACSTMSRRYGVVFDFCNPSEAGEKVLQWLGGEHGNS